MVSCKDCIYCYVDSNVIPYAYCALGIVKFFDLSEDEEVFLRAETCSEYETDIDTVELPESDKDCRNQYCIGDRVRYLDAFDATVVCVEEDFLVVFFDDVSESNRYNRYGFFTANHLYSIVKI